jgi:hypothetical protein
VGERACNTFSCVQVLFDLDKTKTSALSVAPKYKSIRIYIYILRREILLWYLIRHCQSLPLLEISTWRGQTNRLDLVLAINIKTKYVFIAIYVARRRYIILS